MSYKKYYSCGVVFGDTSNYLEQPNFVNGLKYVLESGEEVTSGVTMYCLDGNTPAEITYKAAALAASVLAASEFTHIDNSNLDKYNARQKQILADSVAFLSKNSAPKKSRKKAVVSPVKYENPT